MDYGIVITGIVLLGLTAILVYLYISVRPTLPYLYVNTMLQSRGGKFLSKEKRETLAQSNDLVEFVNNLTGTFYEVDGADLADIHDAFTHKYVDLLKDIKKHTPKEFISLLDTYALLAESAVVRYMYRSKFFGRPIKNTYVYSVGSITTKQLTAMQKAENFAEFKALFSPTMYRRLLLQEYKTVDEFDSALDSFVSNHIQQKLTTLKVADKHKIKDLFFMIIDQHNVMAIFQSIIREESPHLLDGGFLGRSKLEKVKSVSELEEKIQGSIYATVFSAAKAEYDKTDRAAYIEIAFERFILDTAKKEVLSKPQGAFSVFVHLLQAKQDKQNVQVISKGIEAKLPSEKIMELVI